MHPRLPRRSFMLAALAACLVLTSKAQASVTWSRWAMPYPRYDHVAAYDPVRDRMIVYGGFTVAGPDLDSNELWGLRLGDAVSWEWLGYSKVAPLPRSGATAVYDPAAHRMVMFGGEYGGHDMRDTWSLALDTGAWSQDFSGTLPPSGYLASGAFDSKRKRLLVIPSSGGMMYQLDLVTNVWSMVDTTAAFPGPGPMTHDAPRNRLILRNRGTWELSLSGKLTWRPLVTAGTPPPDDDGNLFYDAQRDRLLQVCNNGTVWALSLNRKPTWTSIAKPPLPTGGLRARIAHDTGRDRLIFFGSNTGNDAWAFDLATATWSLLLAGSPIPVLSSPAAVVVRPWDAMVVFAGTVWRFPMSGTGAFEQVAAAGAGPETISGNAAIYDPVRERMLVFSGDQVYALSIGAKPTWSQLAPAGTPPPPRTEAHAIYDPIRDRMVVFGGKAGSPVMDTWALSLGEVPEWRLLAPGSALPELSSNHLVYDSRRDRVIAIGLDETGGFTASYWMPLGAPGSWTSLGVFSGRRFFTAEYDSTADRVRLFGGADAEMARLTDELWDMSPTGAWAPVRLRGMKPLPGYQQALIRDPLRNQLVLFGGAEALATLPDPASSWPCSEVWFMAPNPEADVDPPAAVSSSPLAFHGLRLEGPSRIAFTLKGVSDGTVAVDVYDLAGRWLGGANIAGNGGACSGAVSLGAAVPAGIVLVRASQGAFATVGRIAVLH